VAELSDQELLEALGVPSQPKAARARTPREERIIAGFEDIVRFREAHGRAPQHGEGRDIFERIYAMRLDRLRSQADCFALLRDRDPHGLLQVDGPEVEVVAEHLDDAALLAALGVAGPAEGDITRLTHVASREEKRAAEEIADRIPCADFAAFKPLFDRLKADLDAGVRETRTLSDGELTLAEIRAGEFFIVGGQVAYVAEAGGEFVTDYDRRDRRLRVIYDNGTESNVLARSLQKALYRDGAGRRITNPIAGPLFGHVAEDGDTETGTIYVLRSRSDHPVVAVHRELVHKIGVTSGSVEARIAAAATDATYLLAGVDVVAAYKLFNINRAKLEALLHRVFARARLDLTIEDRFGHPVQPREWYLVPVAAIDEAVQRVRDQSIVGYEYDPATGVIRKSEGVSV
jgi:hypothetical protein